MSASSRPSACVACTELSKLRWMKTVWPICTEGEANGEGDGEPGVADDIRVKENRTDDGSVSNDWHLRSIDVSVRRDVVDDWHS